MGYNKGVKKEFKANQKPNRLRHYQREGISFKKSFFLFLILFLQLVLLIIIYVNFIQALTWVYTASFIISVLTCLRVMLYTKNAAAKASWVMFLLLFPTFGFLIYYLSGGSDLHPRHKRKLEEIDRLADPYLIKNDFTPLSTIERQHATFLQNVTNAAVYHDDDLQYYGSGEAIFLDMIKALHHAKKSIYLEFFIIRQGELFTEIMNILIDKAKSGVDVKIIYDGFGSKDLMTIKLRKTLREANIKIKPFEPITPIFSFFLNYRNHRKMVVIDHEVAYIGGFNLADEYVNIIDRFGYWKDSGLRLSGPSVTSFAHAFLKMWMFVSKEKVDFSIFSKSRPQVLAKDRGIVVPYVCGPYQNGSVARSFYMKLLSSANESIWIMTPYLIIDEAIFELLKNKVSSGVRVHLVIPGIPDKNIVYSLTREKAFDLSKAGCHVYVFSEGFIHSKNVLVDHKAAVVGSINFDYRSFYHQYENAVYFTNPKVIAQLSMDFKETIERSDKLTRSPFAKVPFFYRIYLGLLKWISPIM